MKTEKLIEEARKARKRAYAPYSGFSVGASLLTEDGEVYAGGNIENQINRLSVCAEQVALFKALSEGEKSFSKLAVVSKKEKTPPCGACRQTLYEHAPELEIIMADLRGNYEKTTLKELLPLPFGLGED